MRKDDITHIELADSRDLLVKVNGIPVAHVEFKVDHRRLEVYVHEASQDGNGMYVFRPLGYILGINALDFTWQKKGH